MQLLDILAIGLTKLIVAAIAGYMAYRGLYHYEEVRLTATTLVALSGTLTGFILTALSVLVSSADRPFMVNLRKTGHYLAAVSELIYSAGLWVLVIVVALISHFLSGDAQKVVLALAAGIMALSLIVFTLAGIKFCKVIRSLAEPPG